LFLSQKGGDALHCINAYEAPRGCGTGAECQNCVVRNSVREAFSGAKTARRRCQLRLRRGKRPAPIPPASSPQPAPTSSPRPPPTSGGGER
jgi:hypothetical protein